MGDNAWYRVIQTPDSGAAKLREEADFGSAPVGEAEGEVRVDKILELPGGKMRAHICQNVKNVTGWASLKLLECRSGHCGHCYRCSWGTLPSENFATRQAQRDRISSLKHERNEAEVRFAESEKRITLAASDSQKHLHAMLSKSRLKLCVTEKMKVHLQTS